MIHILIVEYMAKPQIEREIEIKWGENDRELFRYGRSS
jgi:hypothetical protein